MGQKSSVPLQTTVTNNKQPPPVKRKPQAPLPPFRIHSFVVPENKVLPTGVAPRRLRPVSAELATRNSDFATIWGNPVTALNEQIRDSIQKETLDRHAANLASIIAGTEGKYQNAKNVAPPLATSTLGNNPDILPDQWNKEKIQENAEISKIMPENGNSNFNFASRPEMHNGLLDRRENRYKSLEELKSSSKENLDRITSSPPGLKRNTSVPANGNLPRDFTTHRRHASTSTFSSQPVVPEDTEDMSSYSSETFSRMSNTSLPQKCSFHIDRTQSLTYAQLAEMRRQNSLLDSLDSRSNIGSAPRLNQDPYHNGKDEFDVIERRRSRKKKRAPDPPSLAKSFSLSSHHVREDPSVLDSLPELEPSVEMVTSGTELEKDQTELQQAKSDVSETIKELSKDPVFIPPRPRWFTSSSPEPGPKPSLMSDSSTSLSYRNLITPVLFKSDPAKNIVATASVPNTVTPQPSINKTSTLSTPTTSQSPEKLNQNKAKLTDTTGEESSAQKIGSTEESLEILEKEKIPQNVSLLSDKEKNPPMTSPQKTPIIGVDPSPQIASDQPNKSDSSTLQSLHPSIPPPLASSEPYGPSASHNEAEKPIEISSTPKPEVPPIWKPPTQDDISMLLDSSEKNTKQ